MIEELKISNGSLQEFTSHYNYCNVIENQVVSMTEYKRTEKSNRDQTIRRLQILLLSHIDTKLLRKKMSYISSWKSHHKEKRISYKGESERWREAIEFRLKHSSDDDITAQSVRLHYNTKI